MEPRKRFLRREPSQGRSRALVESIVTAFDQLVRAFDDEGEVTIERLVERAGVSIGSFYEYFKNKDGLLGVVLERATRENFESLLRAYDAEPHPDLESAVRFLAARLVETYLAHPARTRLLLAGIGRLDWLRVITSERDRFARHLAERAARLLPQATHAQLEPVMIELCDIAMGVLVSQLYRAPRPPEDVAEQLATLGLAVIHAKLPGSEEAALATE
jgi:AcrR family transcriptional regulator